MGGIEFARRLAQVQDELGDLCNYLMHNSGLGERADYLLLGRIHAVLDVPLSFNESIRATTRSL